MIQRIQTLFLLGAIIVLTIVSFYGSFFTVITDTGIVEYTGKGEILYTHDKAHVIAEGGTPIMIISLALAALALLTLLRYKKLAEQLKLAKILWGLYLLAVIGVVVWQSFIAPSQIQGEIIQSNFGAAFYILVIGIAFVHMAFVGIRKDKATIDSLNRLR